MFIVEIDLASSTPKQVDNEEEYIPDKTDAPQVATTSQQPTMQTFSAMFPKLHHEDESQYQKRIDDIRSQLQPFETPSDLTIFFTRFYQRNQISKVNQVCPLGFRKLLRLRV